LLTVSFSAQSTTMKARRSRQRVCKV